MEPNMKKHTIIALAGENRSGIDLGPTGGRRALARMFPPDVGPGLVVENGAAREWKILGITELGGRLYAYGHPVEAEGFLEKLAELAGTEAIAALRGLVRACGTLAAEGRLPSRLYPGGILFLERKGFLFLPDSIMEKALSVLPLENRTAEYEVFNHPDLAGEAGLSFSLGCLAYRIVTGVLPWDEIGEEELHTAMRSRLPLPPRLKKPGIRDEVSAFIMRAFSEGEKPNLAEWDEALSAWISRGAEFELGDEELEARRREAARAEAERAGKAARRRFWERNRTGLFAAAVVAVVAGSIAWSVASNLLKPRATKGFPPEEVVRTFYRSMNTFDHVVMEDCVLGDAGKAYIGEAMNLFVVSRMRLSAEMSTGFVDAEEWTRKGRPEVPAGKVVYGIADLAVKRTGGSEENPEYLVSFEHWAPVPAEPDSKQPPKSRGIAIGEKVTMVRSKGDWVIGRIERISEKPL